jgi:hypothetical protein
MAPAATRSDQTRDVWVTPHLGILHARAAEATGGGTAADGVSCTSDGTDGCS